MAEVKLKEETESRGPCGSWGPAEVARGSGVEPAHLKEEEPELCIKQEPQEFPLHMVSVKSEEDEDKSSVLHQRATEENREETNVTEAGCSSDPLTQFHSDSEEHTDSSEDTEHSEDYSQQQAHSKRSYAMVPPDHTPYSCSGQRPYCCSECGRSFRWKSHLWEHKFLHLGKSPYKCSVCEKSFAHKVILIKHLKSLHHMCTVCEACFPDDTALKEHLKSHVEDGTAHPLFIKSNRCSHGRPYSCSECGKEFPIVSRLQRHMLVHAEGRPHKCSFCDKRFKAKSHLQFHMSLHSGQRPFVCSVCGKGFGKKSHLTQHQKCVHLMCPVCGQRFPDKVKVNEHVSAHADDRPGGHDGPVGWSHTDQTLHTCSLCHKCFCNTFHLSRHLRDQHHMCPFCNEAFSTSSKLKGHLRTHAEEQSILRPELFHCSICEKRFKEKSHLTEHMKVHTDKKPYVCSLCKKAYTYKCNLTLHHRHVHCICPVCGEQFLTQTKLKEHLKGHVTEEWTVDQRRDRKQVT
ncbi:uncharacterized protein [Eucyclogobius newberryi]|uniref:uncharacterized protein n=1 Tax=Eucyclogobius newberryi TaxID=166745 RepID=UPI003B5B6B3A